MGHREPIIARGGLFRLAGLIALTVAGLEFSSWLRPIVATALGRDINAVQSYQVQPAKTVDRVPRWTDRPVQHPAE